MRDDSFELDIIEKAEEILKVITPRIEEFTESHNKMVGDEALLRTALQKEQERVDKLIEKIDTAKSSPVRKELYMAGKRPKSLRALRDDLRDSEDAVRDLLAMGWKQGLQMHRTQKVYGPDSVVLLTGSDHTKLHHTERRSS